ncbi:MAG: lysine--tRNA ligase [bacterium]|nr:lysine--tRNA ligase [bacterium]
MNSEGSYGSDLREVKLEKLEKLRELGVDPYPTKFDRTHYSSEIIEDFEKLEKSEEEVAISGRIIAIRKMGKAVFAHIRDYKGKIQLYIRKDQVGDDKFEIFGLMDIGDFIGIKGKVFKTRTEEITVLAADLQLLTKSLLPLPIVKEEEVDGKIITHDAFSDKELRYRRRYLDLAVNAEVKDVFIKRASIVSSMRRLLEGQNFIEVETPVLQPIYGGASARPFKTYHNTLGVDLYLRIADELYLKRLIVGGFDGVFEISKDFRNEGIDKLHNPEFTMMEIYVAYHNYEYMMELTENLVADIAKEVLGTTEVEFMGNKIDFAPPWERLTMFDAVKRYTGLKVEGASKEVLKKYADDLEMEIEDFWGPGKIVEEIYGEFVEGKIVRPTFITNYPAEISPLAKRSPENPDMTERFEAVVCGFEIANGYSELNDPQDQKQRFMEQMEKSRLGDLEAQVLDEDYIMALEYGMPPTTGLGVGVDRLTMLMTDTTSIRDVILFPQMKPKTE